jgi:peptidoglycan/LPS O-acetylase OafA/YrhL
MQRDSGIDFIKFIAAILITNSHMGHLYPQGLSILATGGAIGDALFFFLLRIYIVS